MHEDYEDDSYDDDNSQENLESHYKHYFKFDADAWDAWSKWLSDALKNSIESSPNVWYAYGFPVNSYFSDTVKDNSFQYLGNNYQDVSIWKKKYSVFSPFNIIYTKHIESNAKHFLKQPHYYKGLFDILN
jgi:hypothetical protein